MLIRRYAKTFSHVRIQCICGGLSLLGSWAPADPSSNQVSVHREVVPPTTVWAITLDEFWNEQQPVVVTLYERDRHPVHAFAQIPSEAPAVHRVDLTPAAPIEYLLEGQRFHPPEHLKGAYDYLKPEFLEYRKKYLAGKLVMRNYDVPPPLRMDADEVRGVFDVFFLYPDARQRATIRVRMTAKKSGDSYLGSYEAFDYSERDEKFSPRTRWTGNVRVRPVPGAWQAGPDRVVAPGAAWPQQHGPFYNGSAADCADELVDSISEARLQWVADLPIPGGRGEIPRSAFGFFPLARSGLGITQYSAPIVAEGRVYLAIPMVDEEALAKHPEVPNHPRVIRGVDPRALGPELSLMRDTLLCFDAATGRLLWRFYDSRHMGLIGASKSGRGLTAAYANGKVVFRGQTSLYCVDASTGQLRWRNDGQKPTKEAPGYSFGTAQPWSTDHSPIIVDGVVVVRINDTPKPSKGKLTGSKSEGSDSSDSTSGLGLESPPEHSTWIGLDLETGKLLWRVPYVAGKNSIPTVAILGGRPYLVAAADGSASPSANTNRVEGWDPQGQLSLIEPRTGRVVWQRPMVGPNSMYPLIWGDVVGLNVERNAVRPDSKGKMEPLRRLGAVRIAMDGARVLWTSPHVEYPAGRFTPIAHRGVFLVDSRETGFRALRAETGESIGEFPHLYQMFGGSHNWTWIIASNGRIITSGDKLHMFRLDNHRLTLLPGELPVDLASGYVCPIRPAMADGRLFLRTFDSLVCYDLRKPKRTRSE
jgi:outer membrane protein assembly factor BamB